MKLLFFNTEYPPLGGGAGNANYYIFKEFSKFPDLKIDFITSSVDKDYHLEKMGENINIHRLPIGKNNQNLHYQSQKELLVYAWKAFSFAKKLIKNSPEKYDLSHSFFTVPCGYISYLLKRKYGIPYIISLRGSDVPGYSERFSFIYRLITPLITKIWKNSFGVVSNSQGLKDLALKANDKQKIGVIYNGIAIDEFKPAFEKRNHDELKILCVSRLTARKGINYLIEAAAILLQKNLKIKLELIGEGDQAENLKKLAEEKNIKNQVDFLGRIEHANLPDYYQKADVFALPSLNEGMSNTMLEALAAGLPLVATDTGGTRELLIENQNGFIIKIKDSQDTADKIEKLINDSDLKEKMSVASRHLAEKMSWENVAKEYFNLYKSVNNR